VQTKFLIVGLVTLFAASSVGGRFSKTDREARL
jgi:hypothetical protein